MQQQKINPIVPGSDANSSSQSPPGPLHSRKGFASMTIEQRRRIASMGGKAVRPEQRSFSQNRELASRAGKKGGISVPPEKRSFSQDRELAARSGRKGGEAVPSEKRSFSYDRKMASEAGRKGGRGNKGGCNSEPNALK